MVIRTEGHIVLLISLFVLISLLSTSATADAAAKTSDSSLIAAIGDPAILKNETILG
jgi:hypothetical protein